MELWNTRTYNYKYMWNYGTGTFNYKYMWNYGTLEPIIISTCGTMEH